MNTIGYGGKRLDKTIRVYTNDSTQVRILSIGGRVKTFANFSRRYVVFKGAVGTPLRQTITITQTEEFPFNITNVTAETGEFLRFKIKQIPDHSPKKYELFIENTRDTVGNYSDKVILHTDSNVHKQIEIQVVGRIHG